MADKESVFAYRSDAVANKYQGFVPKEIKDVEAYIENNTKAFNQPETWFQLVMIDMVTHEIIGDIGIHFIGQDNLQSEIGCTLNKKFQSKGYATEALKTIMDYLFYDLNKHRIIASIDPDNIDSIRLVERLGFRKEAHHKESLLFKGEWVDDVIYAVLGREWKGND